MFLGIGSNIQPQVKIQQVKKVLREQFAGAKFSRTFESEAVGFDGDNFLNLVAEIETSYSLDDLIVELKHLEDQLGRQRGGAKFSARHIDIDILLYGDLMCNEPIVLPREEICENAYVLWPLAELAPDLQVPGSQLTYAELWNQFDKSRQHIKPID